MLPTGNCDDPSFSTIDPSMISTEKGSPVLFDSSSLSARPARRTYVILTELDEPFFGPYPIEFTITIWMISLLLSLSLFSSSSLQCNENFLASLTRSSSMWFSQWPPDDKSKSVVSFCCSLLKFLLLWFYFWIPFATMEHSSTVHKEVLSMLIVWNISILSPSFHIVVQWIFILWWTEIVV